MSSPKYEDWPAFLSTQLILTKSEKEHDLESGSTWASLGLSEHLWVFLSLSGPLWASLELRAKGPVVHPMLCQGVGGTEGRDVLRGMEPKGPFVPPMPYQGIG